MLMTGVCRCDEITNLTMGEIEDFDSAILVKVRILKITNRDYSPFWESFSWKFAESTSDNLDSTKRLTSTLNDITYILILC
jgi:hypothetical protein